jgi:hypothetical protein
MPPLSDQTSAATPPASSEALTPEQQVRLVAAVNRHIKAGALQIPPPEHPPDY